MASKNGNALAGGAVPYADGLVVRAGDLKNGSEGGLVLLNQLRAYNPWHFMMELDGSDVVKMAMKGEEAASVLRSDI